MFLFSRYLSLLCLNAVAAGHEREFLAELMVTNGTRSKFTAFKELTNCSDPEIKRIIDTRDTLPTLNGRSHLMYNALAEHNIAVRENIIRNLRKRLLIFYKHIRCKLFKHDRL